MRDWLQGLRDTLARDAKPVVRVVVATVRGSAPREPGASMLVGRDAVVGTIGGGHLELVATRIAGDLLAAAPGASRLDRFPLGASLGQCCGGIVDLWFERYDVADVGRLDQALRLRSEGATAAAIAASASGDPHAARYERFHSDETPLWLFGAGHVGRALVNVLADLPFRITWVDSREDPFPEMLPGSVSTLQAPEPAGEVRAMADGAWALVMTHSHDEDLAICRALLEDGRFGWAGVIGSQPKATRFRQRLAQRGFAPAAIARLTMPIGIAGIASKEPAAIAVAVSAQLLQLREERAATLPASMPGVTRT